jgi:serine protease Do
MSMQATTSKYQYSLAHGAHVSPWRMCCTLPMLAGATLLLMLADGVAVFSARAAPLPNIEDAPMARERHPELSFAAVIKKVAPSVVNIYAAKTVRENPWLSPLFKDPMLRQFFGDVYGYDRVPRERREQNLGSGIIMSQDGYILTNNHVVNGAHEIKVALADERRVLDAKVIGTDPHADVAVIKVEGQDLPAITVTDSDKLEVGDVVLAIGNPFGVGQSVTMGIVSAKGRSGMGIVDYKDFIQTDAPINPGYSGGALVDVEGRLVGISTAILSRTGDNQGIGFAIPVNLARHVMERIIDAGKVTRGCLGVKVQAAARKLELPEQNGALIGEVTPNSPAGAAGLKKDDVIVEFDGKTVSDGRHLRLMVTQTPPGAKISVKVLRDGKEQIFTVKLDELHI